MTGTEISELIGALRVETARDSISPEHVGYLLDLLNERIGEVESMGAAERGVLVSALSALEERVAAEEGTTAELLEKVAQMEGYAKKGDVIADGSLTAQSTGSAVVLELELTDGLGEGLSRGVTLPTATETGAGVVTSAQVKLWNGGAAEAEAATAAAESAEAKVDGLRILPFDGFLETTEGVSGEADRVYFVRDVGRFMQQVDGEWTYETSRGGYNMIISAMPELGIAESVSGNPWVLFTSSGNLYRASGSELESVAWSGDVEELLAEKQPMLKSGENVKTLNGVSLLGGGDIEVYQQEEVVTIPEDVMPTSFKPRIAQVAELGSLCILVYSSPSFMLAYDVNTKEFRKYDNIAIGSAESYRFVHEDDEYFYILTYRNLEKRNKATGDYERIYNSAFGYSRLYNIGEYLAVIGAYNTNTIYVYDKDLTLYKELATPVPIYGVSRVNNEVLLKQNNGDGGDWYLLDLNTIETEEWVVKYTVPSSIFSIWQKEGDDFLIGTNGNNKVQLSVLDKEDTTKIYGTSVDQVTGMYSGMSFMNDYFIVRNSNTQDQIIARYATTMGYYASGIHLKVLKILPKKTCSYVVTDKDNLYWIDLRDNKLHILKHD